MRQVRPNKIPIKRNNKRTSKAVEFKSIKPKIDGGLKKVLESIGVPEKTEFIPDEFQLKAIEAIQCGDCLVTAPTGAGKTWIAEMSIERVLKSGGKSWYASPLKALSNSKYHEFSQRFGPSNVGILTGDRKENPDAPIIVGTTEILRNQLYDAMSQGETINTDFVVLDEAHYLGDEERGVVWEEVLIYLPTRIPILMLSATIGNAYQISEWLSSIRQKKCFVIEETKRPVPLFPIFFHPDGHLMPLLSNRRKKTKDILYKKVVSHMIATMGKEKRSHDKIPLELILEALRKYDLLPAIFFFKSRAECDKALVLCASNQWRALDQNSELVDRIDQLVTQSPYLSSHRQLNHLKSYAIGSHHSGQLPAWKLIIETLMTEGLLDAVFATSTVAAGVNFPARTVVFFNSDRFNGKEFVPLTATEFHQMTGRAGRRGMDNIGFAVIVPSRFMDIRLIAKLIQSPPTNVVSQIRINFSMTLNLLLSHTPSQIEDLLKNSFATFLIQSEQKKTLSKRSKDKGTKRLWLDFQRHLEFLEETGFVTQDHQLTEDGIWTSQLRIDQPLIIAECLRKGLLPDTDPVLLAAILTFFVNEQESNNKIHKDLIPKKFISEYAKLKNGLSEFIYLLNERGFELRPFYLRPAVTIYHWANGASWDTVVHISEMEEGNLSMLILRLADHLRHIAELKTVFPETAMNASRAIQLILRDPVITYFDI